MNVQKMIAIGLLALVGLTILGMILRDQSYWDVYNYLTILFGLWGAVTLFRQR